MIYFTRCTINLDVQDMSGISQYLVPYKYTIMCTLIIFMGSIQLVWACVGLYLVVCSKRHFNNDQTGQHPLKLTGCSGMPGTPALRITVPSPTGRMTFPLVLTLARTSMEDLSPLRRWRTLRHSYASFCFSCHFWVSIYQAMAILIG